MDKYIKSTFNYTGGKYKLLEQIKPLFPKNIDTFYDLFCGGLDVSINIDANKIVSNDIISPMIDMYDEFKKYDFNTLNSIVLDIINKYSLSKENNTGYLMLRDDYNKTKESIKLFVLICYCYNNQIRFNSKFNFNRAFGKNRSSYNDSIQENLKHFLNKLNTIEIDFVSKDFQLFDYSRISENDFVYADPPYLITCADYSIQASWNEDKEKKLYDILDELNNRNIKFGLSNVINHHGKQNEILIKWCKKYNTYYLNNDYKNCNANKKCKNIETQEVLITNY